MYKIDRDNASQGESAVTLKDELSCLWEEYQYRHDLVWRVTLRLTFVVSFLSIIPHVYGTLRTNIGRLMLVPPVLSVLLALFGSLVVLNEYRLLQMIRRAYRSVQTAFFSQLLGEGKLCEVPQYPGLPLFGTFLLIYAVSLFGLALVNFVTIASNWQ